MFRKQAKCCNCGFLALFIAADSLEQRELLKDLGLLGSQEYTQQERQQIIEGRHPNPSVLFCTRHVWSGSHFKDKPKETVFQFLNQEQKCPYFYPYNPSYSPVEHRELQREAKTQKLLLVGMLLAALIGALAAIVAQLIAR
jgi:hypothetical protein